MQAAEEYQARIQARKNAEDAKKARMQVEIFDPIRPVDSFNVTHRALLGRCWDRRVPEVAPISFVHTALALEAEAEAAAAAAAAEEEDSCANFALPDQASSEERHPQRSLYETFSPAPPAPGASQLRRHQHKLEARGEHGNFSPLKRPYAGVSQQRNGTPAAMGGGGSVSVSDWNAAIGAGGIPRRSHWFSVIGISTRFSVRSPTTSPEAGSPSVQAHVASLAFPTAGNETSVAAFQEVTKEFPSMLSVDDITKLPLCERVDLANKLMACNPRFYGIKQAYAFRVSEEEVPEDEEFDAGTRFLRNSGLSPARGVKVTKWNRVEFFNPNFITLTKAVAKTEGIAQLTATTIPRTTQCQRSSGVRDSYEAASPLSRGLNRHDSGGNSSNSMITTAGPKTVNAASSMSLDSEGAQLPPYPNTSSMRPAHSLSNLSFLGQHLIANGENFSFAATLATGGSASSSATGSGSGKVNKRNVSGGSSASASPNNSFLHRSLLNRRQHHRSLASKKGGDSKWGIAAHSGALSSMGCKFPEDSVLCLVMEIPPTRLLQLSGVPFRARMTATALLMGQSPTSTTSNNNTSRTFPTVDELNGKMKSTPSSSSVGSKSPVTAGTRSAGISQPTPSGTGSFLIALTISSFSVSIDPFRWEENRYVRYPVDVDGYKGSSRRDYGEGIITDVMYGGVLVIECSSAGAVTHLLSLLRGMKWSENRTARDIVGDVKKRVKQYREALAKHRKNLASRKASAAARKSGNADGAASTSGSCCGGDEDAASVGGKTNASNIYNAIGVGAAEETAASSIESFQYRVSRRIGGRPMRDAVELKQISVYLGDTVVEQSQTLSKPSDGGGLPSPSPNDKFEQQQQQLDPDITPSFSRVASAWVGLPAISAVMRTWGMHLLCNPQYAQPISFFLQRFSGIAPVVQHTALSSLFHMGSTPTDPSLARSDQDDERIQFFENDMGGDYGAATDGVVNAQTPPVRRISKFNPFYASLPGSETLSPTEANHYMKKSASRETIALEEHHDHGTSTEMSRTLLSSNDCAGAGATASSSNPRGNMRKGWSHDTLPPKTLDTLSPSSIAQGHNVALAFPQNRGAGNRRTATVPSSPSTAPATGHDEEAAFQNEVIETGSSDSSTVAGVDHIHWRSERNGTFVYLDSPEELATSPGASFFTHPATSSSLFHAAGPSNLASSGFGSVKHEDSNFDAPPPLMRTRNPTAATEGSSYPPSVPNSPGLNRMPPKPLAPSGTAPPSPSAKKGNNHLAPSQTRSAASPKKEKALVKTKPGKQRKFSDKPSDRPKSAQPSANGQAKNKVATTAFQRTVVVPKNDSGVTTTPAGKQSSFVTTPSSTITPLSVTPWQPPMTPAQEMENLWRIAALEVKAQQKELADVLEMKRKAEEQQSELLNELRALHKAFLPNTSVQELDLAFLYLKTALFEPEDLPYSCVFYNNADWLPMLTALWTSPANSIRCVEIAHPLLCHDLTKLGILTGLLFHKFAAGPLEYLEINAARLLGGAAAAAALRNADDGSDNGRMATNQGGGIGLNDGEGNGKRDKTTATAAKKKSRSPIFSLFANSGKKAKRASKGDKDDDGSDYEPLVFSSLSGMGAACQSLVVGPGTFSPPFYVNPEQARDTLWLLLCGIADNVRCVEFRLCLRGFPSVLSAKDKERVRKEETEQNHRMAFTLLAEGEPTNDGKGDEKVKSGFLLRHKRAASVEHHLALTNTFDLHEDTLNLDSFMVTTSMPDSANHSPNRSFLSPAQTYAAFSLNMSSAESYAVDEKTTPSGLRGTRAQSQDRELQQDRLKTSNAITATNSIIFTRGDSVVLPALGSGSLYRHTHKVRKESWMHAEAQALVFPFYTVLFHPCPELPHVELARQQREQRKRLATACGTQGLAGALLSLADADTASNPSTSHYHNDYTFVHNNNDFYIPPSRQRRLAELAVKAALAQEALTGSSSIATAGLDGADVVPLTASATALSSPLDQSVGADGLRSSWGMSDLCLAQCNVFGLKSSAEEAAVYTQEEARLLRHSDEIWAVLRRATQRYNTAATTTTAAAGVSGSSGTASPQSPIQRELNDRKAAAQHHVMNGSQSDFDGTNNNGQESSKWRRVIILER